ncbi:MAG: succinyl-diaminopimelate desuccinylase [Endozoicomonadaceae bacterium]|nr:succinyl-diaminopimelate desuccinylase [Endozoicomonadaceae bacterium]
MSKAVQLATELVARPSITPDDQDCQLLLAERLAILGFKVEHFQDQSVKNAWIRKGKENPLFVFAGHTDVVPTGSRDLWHYDPFILTESDGFLYGRGIADMKGNIAAMVIATAHFIEKHPNHKGSIAFLLTSDEEGPAIDGTIKVIDRLKARQEIPTWCVVGEPSSQDKVGDTIKVGRRGSLTGIITIRGIQGHVAYPHLADNPMHKSFNFLQQLISESWDEGTAEFPPTTFQMVHCQSGGEASNIIPEELKVQFNLRYAPCTTANQLIERIENKLKFNQLNHCSSIQWVHSAKPFFTGPGFLRDQVVQVIQEVTGFSPKCCTSGGTSDGRFIAPLGTELIELGVCNRTIHQMNECVKREDIDDLTILYERLLTRLLT